MPARKKLLTLVFALLGLPILASTAFAQATPEKPIQGTIAVTEDADYQALAKITAEQARATALAEVPGAEFKEEELEEEDGYLVYEVELIQDGREIEVLIDAGDGSVLAVESDDDK